MRRSGTLHPSHSYSVFLQLLVIYGRNSRAAQRDGHQNAHLSSGTTQIIIQNSARAATERSETFLRYYTCARKDVWRVFSRQVAQLNITKWTFLVVKTSKHIKIGGNWVAKFCSVSHRLGNMVKKPKLCVCSSPPPLNTHTRRCQTARRRPLRC